MGHDGRSGKDAADGERNKGHAVVTVLSYPDFQGLETCCATVALKMPYVPGLLMVDGQGQAHPRGFGIPCYLRVRWDVPSVGVAKTFRYGKYDAGALGDPAGSSVPLLDRAGQRLIGSITRPKARTNPLFLSPGHRVSVESTTQQAHTLITTFKKAGAAGLMTAAPVPTQETFSS